MKQYVHSGRLVPDIPITHQEVEPFRDLNFMSHIVLNHALNVLYYDSMKKGLHIESIAFFRYPVKELYRWYFTDEHTEEILKILPKRIIPQLENNIVIIDINCPFELPIMLGEPVETNIFEGFHIFEIIFP